MLKKNGFSLLEIIVATVIISLTILGLLGVFAAGNYWVIHFRDRSTGAELGKFFIDPLQMQVRQDQWGTNGLSTNTIPVDIQRINGKDFRATYSTEVVAGTEVRKASTVIFWREANTPP